MNEVFLGRPSPKIEEWIKNHKQRTVFVMSDGQTEEYSVDKINVEWLQQNGFVQSGTWLKNFSRVEIGWEVVEIGEGSFQNNTALESVIISGNVRKIGTDAFKGCTSVIDVVCVAHPRTLQWDDGNCDDFRPNRETVLHVNSNFLDMYVGKFQDKVNVTFQGDGEYSTGTSVKYDELAQSFEIPIQDIGLAPGTYSVGYVGEGNQKLEGFGDIERKAVIS